MATPASAVTRTVRPGASGIASATALNPILPTTVLPPPSEEDDAVASGRPVGVEEDDYGQLLRRPGEMPPRQQRLRQPGRPHPGQPGRFPPGGVPPSTVPPNGVPATAAGPATACPALGRADLRARAGRTAGTQWRHAPRANAAYRVPRWRHAPPDHTARRSSERRTARRPRQRRSAHGAPPHGGPPNAGAPHGGTPNGGAAERRAAMPNGGQVPGRQSRLPNGRRVSPGADRLTGRRGQARRAGHRAAPRAGSGHPGPARRQLEPPAGGTGAPRRHRGRAHRGQAVPFPVDRPQVRLTGVRSPTAAPGLPG